MQYSTIAEHGINGTQPAAPAGVVNKGNRQILNKLYIAFNQYLSNDQCHKQQIIWLNRK